MELITAPMSGLTARKSLKPRQSTVPSDASKSIFLWSLSSGKQNVLAIEVIPPAKGEPTIGFVDWNPAPPDKSLSLWRGARIRLSGDVSIKNPFIETYVDKATLK